MWCRYSVLHVKRWNLHNIPTVNAFGYIAANKHDFLILCCYFVGKLARLIYPDFWNKWSWGFYVVFCNGNHVKIYNLHNLPHRECIWPAFGYIVVTGHVHYILWLWGYLGSTLARPSYHDIWNKWSLCFYVVLLWRINNTYENIEFTYNYTPWWMHLAIFVLHCHNKIFCVCAMRFWKYPLLKQMVMGLLHVKRWSQHRECSAVPL